MSASISLVINQLLGFVTVMMTSILGLSSDCLFGKMTSPHVDLGAQSGNETQYVFSEGDVHPSDADNVGLAAEGEFIIP